MTVTQRTWLMKEMSEALLRYVQQSTGESPRSTWNAATICVALTRVILVQLFRGRPNVDSEELQQQDRVIGSQRRRGRTKSVYVPVSPPATADATGEAA